MVRMRSAVRIRPAAPHKPCNHNGYRVCFILSFLGFVGLSNKFSNKLLLCLFLQCRNDQSGDVGISLQQTVCLFRCIIQRLFLRRISPFLEEICLHLLGQPAALLVVGMGIEICHHTGLGMAGIALHRLDVSTADLQLQRSAAMPLRYNYDKPEKPRISRVFGYLARFFHPFPNRKIEPRSSYIVGGVIVTTKTKYRLGGQSAHPRNQDISSEKKKCPFFVPKIRCRQEEYDD